MDGDAKDVSTRPYLLRALYERCSDNGLTPYIVVRDAAGLLELVQFNALAPSIQSEQRLERMAQAMGLGCAQDIPAAIRDMSARLGLPSGLSAMGVERSWYDRIVAGAMADHCHKTNPRIATEDDYRAMLDASM